MRIAPPLPETFSQGRFHLWTSMLHREIRKEAVARFGRDPYRSFMVHRANARKRGIEFRLDFPGWWELVGPTFDKRGTGKNVMCRNADAGAYEAGNVRIATSAQNVIEGAMLRRFREFDEEWGDNAQASDWLENRRDTGYF